MPLPSADIIDRFIGMRLREERQKQRIAMSDLGAAIGVTSQQIQKYETGSNRISARTLYRLATILHISPLAFYEGLDNDPPGSGDEAQPNVVRARITQIVAGLDAEALGLVSDFLVTLQAPDPVLSSSEPARAVPRECAPLIEKRRRMRRRPKAGE